MLLGDGLSRGGGVRGEGGAENRLDAQVVGEGAGPTSGARQLLDAQKQSARLEQSEDLVEQFALSRGGEGFERGSPENDVEGRRKAERLDPLGRTKVRPEMSDPRRELTQGAGQPPAAAAADDGAEAGIFVEQNAADEAVLAVDIEEGRRRVDPASNQAKNDLDVFDAERFWRRQMIHSPGNDFGVRPNERMSSGRDQRDINSARGGFPLLKNLEISSISKTHFVAQTCRVKSKRTEPFGPALT